MNRGIWFCCGRKCRVGPTQLHWLIVHQSPKVFKSRQPWQPEETGSCGDVTLCFELFPRVDVNHWDLFSVKIRDVFYSTCVCRVAPKSVWRQPGSLRPSPRSRQCHWDYSRLHNSPVIPAITIWHLCLCMAFNSQTGSSRAARPEPDDVTLSVKNMAFQVKGQTNLLTWIPTILSAPTSGSAAKLFIWCTAVYDYFYHRTDTLSSVHVCELYSSDYIMRWLVLNLHPAMPSHADPRRSRQKKKKKHEQKLFAGTLQSFFFFFNLRAADNQNICAGLKSIQTVTLCATRRPQIRWCHAPRTPRCISLSLSCISQHMLPLLIYVTVRGTASLSQSSDTTCVRNECVYVAWVCVCVCLHVCV